MDVAIDDAGLGAVAFEFSEQSRGMETIPELVAALQAAILPLEITAAASGYISGPRAASLKPFHFTTWAAAWVNIYLANGFLLVDPLPRWARSCGRPITWSALFEILPARDPGRSVLDAATEFGFREGMAIPTRAVDGALGLVAFATTRPALNGPEIDFLTVIGRATFEAAERIEREGEPGRVAPIMTEREINCMALLVQGHSDRQIGTILGVSAPTVRFHLSNARAKCGAASRTHLAALAVTMGYVSF